MKKLADNDELGNPVAHFFKSGNVLRSSQNDKLTDLKSMIPESWANGTRIEYDVWYDVRGNDVHGYVYTDVLCQFLYLRVASQKFSSAAMFDAASCDVTDEGIHLFNTIAKTSGDKYRLRKKSPQEDFVIFLPGTNILNKMVEWGKIDNAVKQGAKLKCHPLTAAPAMEHLKYKYKDAVIDKKISGHALLDSAAIVGCCANSEMGLAALAKGKTVYDFGRPNVWATYSAIYNALLVNGSLSPQRFKSILSSQSSGLVPADVADPQERITKFFDRYKKEKHIAPKNSGHRVQLINRPND